MLYLFDNQIVISIIINIYYPELRLLTLLKLFSTLVLQIISKEGFPSTKRNLKLQENLLLEDIIAYI
jgi:hypothetical protein